MSFSQKQKADLINQPIRTSCCKKSFLQGILAARGSLVSEGIVISVESIESAEYINTLILDVYSKEADSVVSIKGGRRRLLEFSAKSAEKYITDFLKGETPYTSKCDMCRSEFLRGVFLAAGRVSDPEIGRAHV